MEPRHTRHNKHYCPEGGHNEAALTVVSVTILPVVISSARFHWLCRAPCMWSGTQCDSRVLLPRDVSTSFVQEYPLHKARLFSHPLPSIPTSVADLAQDLAGLSGVFRYGSGLVRYVRRGRWDSGTPHAKDDWHRMSAGLCVRYSAQRGGRRKGGPAIMFLARGRVSLPLEFRGHSGGKRAPRGGPEWLAFARGDDLGHLWPDWAV